MMILMDGSDAGVMRRRRIGDEGYAPDTDLAAIRRIEACHQLDQRRFAGAVLPEERVDFAGPHFEMHIARARARPETIW